DGRNLEDEVWDERAIRHRAHQRFIDEIGDKIVLDAGGLVAAEVADRLPLKDAEIAILTAGLALHADGRADIQGCVDRCAGRRPVLARVDGKAVARATGRLDSDGIGHEGGEPGAEAEGGDAMDERPTIDVAAQQFLAQGRQGPGGRHEKAPDSRSMMVITGAAVRWTVAGFGPGRAVIVREKAMLVNIDAVSKWQRKSWRATGQRPRLRGLALPCARGPHTGRSCEVRRYGATMCAGSISTCGRWTERPRPYARTDQRA